MIKSQDRSNWSSCSIFKATCYLSDELTSTVLNYCIVEGIIISAAYSAESHSIPSLLPHLPVPGHPPSSTDVLHLPSLCLNELLWFPKLIISFLYFIPPCPYLFVWFIFLHHTYRYLEYCILICLFFIPTTNISLLNITQFLHCWIPTTLINLVQNSLEHFLNK